jgi:stearoyl-CoA desaturase (delta-9 desaturase)
LDLITPAKTWAQLESEPSQDHHALEMPLLQRVVMFVSLVGPFVGLLAAIYLFWGGGWGGISWLEVAVMIAMYLLAGYGVTIGFHRLLTHKAFETYRPLRILFAILGSIGAQGAVVRWCGTHRRHHQTSDREGDPHSPHLHGESLGGFLKGMYHAHVGWCFKPDKAEMARSVPDLLADRVMLVVDQLYWFWVFLGILAPAIPVGLWSGTWQGFVSGLLWGGLVRIFLMQHVTWSINSVCHVWGTRPFNNADHSTNNFPIAILSLGEGWHNNHHAFPTSARQGLRWWQFDSSWLIIRAMKALGLAWEVRTPTTSAVLAKVAR